MFVIFLVSRLVVYYIKKHTLFFGSILILAIVLITVFYVLFPTYNNDDITGHEEKAILIPKGASLREIADIMEENDLLQHKTMFVFLGKIYGYQNKLQAGLFAIPEDLHPWQLLKYLAQPKLASIKVTLPEGLESTEIAGQLSKQLAIDSTRFIQLVNDTMECRKFGIKAENMEGYLHPETYFFNYQMDEAEIISILVNATLSIFEADSVQDQMTELRMDRQKILTMASIIEGEVVVDSERVLVSSVYYNRLHRGWLLGADPTIQYIIPGPPRRLLNKDLDIDSPYNTYKYRGLPPGPINNPGRKSIMAALYPADTRYMYFVATGDGGHHFSRTAAEHARWKENFDRLRREVRRKERKSYQ